MPSQGFGQYARLSPNHLAIAAPDGRHWSRGELWSECQRCAGRSISAARAQVKNANDAATSAVNLIAQALAVEACAQPAAVNELSKMLKAYRHRMQALGIEPREDNVHYCVAPSGHGDSLTWVLASLHHGHAVVLAREWQPEQMLRAVQRYQVTTAYLDDRQARDLLSLDDDAFSGYDTSSLRQLIHDDTGSASGTRRELQARLGIAVPG